MTIYRQFRVTYRKRLLVYSLLCVALATGNALFWLHKWHEQGVELCFADTMMTGVQPSFLLMIAVDTFCAVGVRDADIIVALALVGNIPVIQVFIVTDSYFLFAVG